MADLKGAFNTCFDSCQTAYNVAEQRIVKVTPTIEKLTTLIKDIFDKLIKCAASFSNNSSFKEQIESFIKCFRNGTAMQQLSDSPIETYSIPILKDFVKLFDNVEKQMAWSNF